MRPQVKAMRRGRAQLPRVEVRESDSSGGVKEPSTRRRRLYEDSGEFRELMTRE